MVIKLVAVCFLARLQIPPGISEDVVIILPLGEIDIRVSEFALSLVRIHASILTASNSSVKGYLGEATPFTVHQVDSRGLSVYKHTRGGYAWAEE